MRLISIEAMTYSGAHYKDEYLVKRGTTHAVFPRTETQWVKQKSDVLALVAKWIDEKEGEE